MKYLKFILLVIILCLLVVVVNADGLSPLIYQYTDPEITVTFLGPLEVSAERQKEIADSIANQSSNTISSPDIASPANLICTIFGHDLAPQASVTATHHKIRQYNPRCLMEVYHVTYCKRCDYTVTELYNDFYIVCCPED